MNQRRLKQVEEVESARRALGIKMNTVETLLGARPLAGRDRRAHRRGRAGPRRPPDRRALQPAGRDRSDPRPGFGPPHDDRRGRQPGQSRRHGSGPAPTPRRLNRTQEADDSIPFISTNTLEQRRLAPRGRRGPDIWLACDSKHDRLGCTTVLTPVIQRLSDLCTQRYPHVTGTLRWYGNGNTIFFGSPLLRETQHHNPNISHAPEDGFPVNAFDPFHADDSTMSLRRRYCPSANQGYLPRYS